MAFGSRERRSKKMNFAPVDGRDELRQLIQASLAPAPVVAVLPVGAELLEPTQRHTLAPVLDCLLLRPARTTQPRSQIGEIALRDGRAKRCDRAPHRHRQPYRLLSVTVATDEAAFPAALHRSSRRRRLRSPTSPISTLGDGRNPVSPHAPTRARRQRNWRHRHGVSPPTAGNTTPQGQPRQGCLRPPSLLRPPVAELDGCEPVHAQQASRAHVMEQLRVDPLQPGATLVRQRLAQTAPGSATQASARAGSRTRKLPMFPTPAAGRHLKRCRLGSTAARAAGRSASTTRQARLRG